MDKYKPGYRSQFGPTFNCVLKSPSENILSSRCEIVISRHRQVSPPPLTDIHPHTNADLTDKGGWKHAIFAPLVISKGQADLLLQ